MRWPGDRDADMQAGPHHGLRAMEGSHKRFGGLTVLVLAIMRSN